MNRDTTALVMNHLSVFDLVAWGSTCRTMRIYLHHFLQTRVQLYVPFPTTPLGLLCLWAEIRGDVGEAAFFIGNQFGFTTTALARMVKPRGRNFAIPSKDESLGFYGQFERYPLRLIAQQYKPDLHSTNLKVILQRRVKERSMRAIARGLLHKPLHDTIIALIGDARHNQCWVNILRRLTQERKRPTNSHIRKIQRYGFQSIVTTFMGSQFMRQQPFSDEERRSIHANIVKPWVDELIYDWINADPALYQPRSMVDLMNRVTAPRRRELQTWVDEAIGFLQYLNNDDWPLATQLLQAIQTIDLVKIARKYHDFPKLDGRTLTRFACLPHMDDSDLVDLYMRSVSRNMNWATLGLTLRTLWDRTESLVFLTKKDTEMAAEVIQRNPGLTLFVTRVDLAQFPQRFLDEDALNFLLLPFIRADEQSFHPWVAIKSIKLIAAKIQQQISVKTAETLLLRSSVGAMVEKRPISVSQQPVANKRRKQSNQ